MFTFGVEDEKRRSEYRTILETMTRPVNAPTRELVLNSVMSYCRLHFVSVFGLRLTFDQVDCKCQFESNSVQAGRPVKFQLVLFCEQFPIFFDRLEVQFSDPQLRISIDAEKSLVSEQGHPSAGASSPVVTVDTTQTCDLSFRPNTVYVLDFSLGVSEPQSLKCESARFLRRGHVLTRYFFSEPTIASPEEPLVTASLCDPVRWSADLRDPILTFMEMVPRNELW